MAKGSRTATLIIIVARRTTKAGVVDKYAVVGHPPTSVNSGVDTTNRERWRPSCISDVNK